MRAAARSAVEVPAALVELMAREALRAAPGRPVEPQVVHLGEHQVAPRAGPPAELVPAELLVAVPADREGPAVLADQEEHSF